MNSILSSCWPNQPLADLLFVPQQWSERQWKNLIVTTKEAIVSCNCLRIIAMISALVPVMIVAIPAYVLGLVGVAIKTSTHSEKTTSEPMLEFDTPTKLSIVEVRRLQIRKDDLRSDLPEYSDSRFEVCFHTKDGELFDIVTRRRAPMETPSSSENQPQMRLPSKRAVRVTPLFANTQTFAKIGKLAREWQSIALKKRDLDPSSRVFDDLSNISKLVAQCMEDPLKTTGIWNEIFVCEDVALKEIQAIALVRRFTVLQQCKIAHLVTHPRNVRSPVNAAETTRVEGAASALVNHLISNLPPNQEIYVESVTSAVPFYTKLGFEELDPEEHPPEEWGTTPMNLTAAKIAAIQQVA